METKTLDATPAESAESPDHSGQADGAPSTIDLMGRLQDSLEKDLLDWVTRATPLQVAARIKELNREPAELRRQLGVEHEQSDRFAQQVADLAGALGFEPTTDYDFSDLVKKAVALRTGVDAPLLDLRLYEERDYLSASFVTNARLLEDRGDKCHARFARDGHGDIYGLVLAVEDAS